jgi:hypothetical protein
MGSRSVTNPLHICSSVGGDQPQQLSPLNKFGQQDKDSHPAESANNPAPNNSNLSELFGDGSGLPELSTLNFLAQAWSTITTSISTPAQSTSSQAENIKQAKVKSAKRMATCSLARSSKHKRHTTKEIFMKSIISKCQADISRDRAKARSKIKVEYMKELCDFGLSLEQIEAKISVDFPPLPEMDKDVDKSGNGSNDSS